jgi:hypothetical protein
MDFPHVDPRFSTFYNRSKLVEIMKANFGSELYETFKDKFGLKLYEVLKIIDSDSNLWKMTVKDGDSLAHVAGFFGYLPMGFHQWDIRNNFGATVAHYASLRGRLPHYFKDWHLTDNYGHKVTVTMHCFRSLPEGYDEIVKQIPKNTWPMALFVYLDVIKRYEKGDE